MFYDLERGHGSAQSLDEQAKEEGAVITLEEVKDFMKKQPNKQIVGFQTDIMDMIKFKKEEEERYALIAIDVLISMLTFTQSWAETVKMHQKLEEKHSK